MKSALITRWRTVCSRAEAGMSTAEYAVGTLAACTFAAVLLAVIKEGGVQEGLSSLIQAALSVAS